VPGENRADAGRTFVPSPRDDGLLSSGQGRSRIEGVKAWYVDHVDEKTSSKCRCCGHPLAWVDQVGWVAMSGGSYDLCEVDPYGNHQPTTP